MNAEIKKHWETIYQTKQPNEVSWTEEKPSVSLDLIHSFNPSKSAKIIDIGGGDSKLVDYLLAEGYTDISVLDISEAAIERAKKRLGKNQIKSLGLCKMCWTLNQKNNIRFGTIGPHFISKRKKKPLTPI